MLSGLRDVFARLQRRRKRRRSYAERVQIHNLPLRTQLAVALAPPFVALVVLWLTKSEVDPGGTPIGVDLNRTLVTALAILTTLGGGLAVALISNTVARHGPVLAKGIVHAHRIWLFFGFVLAAIGTSLFQLANPPGSHHELLIPVASALAALLVLAGYLIDVPSEFRPRVLASRLCRDAQPTLTFEDWWRSDATQASLHALAHVVQHNDYEAVEVLAGLSTWARRQERYLLKRMSEVDDRALASDEAYVLMLEREFANQRLLMLGRAVEPVLAAQSEVLDRESTVALVAQLIWAVASLSVAAGLASWVKRQLGPGPEVTVDSWDETVRRLFDRLESYGDPEVEARAERGQRGPMWLFRWLTEAMATSVPKVPGAFRSSYSSAALRLALRAHAALLARGHAWGCPFQVAVNVHQLFAAGYWRRDDFESQLGSDSELQCGTVRFLSAPRKPVSPGVMRDEESELDVASSSTPSRARVGSITSFTDLQGKRHTPVQLQTRAQAPRRPDWPELVRAFAERYFPVGSEVTYATLRKWDRSDGAPILVGAGPIPIRHERDPVCNMDVDRAEPQGGWIRDGDQTVYFCANTCREQYLSRSRPPIREGRA